MHPINDEFRNVAMDRYKGIFATMEVFSAWPPRILTWHRKEQNSQAIAEFMNELVSLKWLLWVPRNFQRFTLPYITLHYMCGKEGHCSLSKFLWVNYLNSTIRATQLNEVAPKSNRVWWDCLWICPCLQLWRILKLLFWWGTTGIRTKLPTV